MASRVNENKHLCTYNLYKRSWVVGSTAVVTCETHLLMRKEEHLGAEETEG